MKHAKFEMMRNKTEEDLQKYFTLMHDKSELDLMESGTDFEKLDLSDVAASKLKEEKYKLYNMKAPCKCALCSVEFPNINMQMSVSRKAISDLRGYVQ